MEKVLCSWSLDDILNPCLFEEEIDEIPQSFESVEQYFNYFKFPLLDETRAELLSSMEVIETAPFAEVVHISECNPLGTSSYEVKVDQWKNRFNGRTNLPYKTFPGDVFIISNGRPEAISDLQRVGSTWAFASVTKTPRVESEDDDGYSSEKLSDDNKNEDNDPASTFFTIRVWSGVPESERVTGKSSFVIFLANILTNIRMWKSLIMQKNLQLIRHLSSTDMVLASGNCISCSVGANHAITETDGSSSLRQLNESQLKAVLTCLHKVGCDHEFSVDLIWGPPGTGKTKTLSTFLASVLLTKHRTLVCTPTNVSIKEVVSRLVMVEEEKNTPYIHQFCPLGDVLLFGSIDRLQVSQDIEKVFLDYRVNELLRCLVPSTGWAHCFSTLVDFLEDPLFQYKIFVQNESKVEEKDNEKGVSTSFDEFVTTRIKSYIPLVESCVVVFCTHLPRSYLPEDKLKVMSGLLGDLSDLENLLFEGGLSSEELQKALSSNPSSPSSINEDLPFQRLVSIRLRCISILKTVRRFLGDMNLPVAFNRRPVLDFCFRAASLLFCTAASSYRLHFVEKRPLDLLVIDEAAQLKECESLIPLQISGLRHIVLAGDECQLPAMVRSKVSGEAGYGRSLFERLSSLGISKHLLNVQYRMHPSISSFPNTKIYMNQILDGSNVKSKDYEKKFLNGDMFGPYSFINVFGGREEEDDVGHSRKNMVEVAVVKQIVKSLKKAWSKSKEKISIGVVSPYAAQVSALVDQIGGTYKNNNKFVVKFNSIDGFQGGEEDIIILSTVRSNVSGSVGFLADLRRTNVAITRARYCLWIIGNGKTLKDSDSIWEELVLDAKRRNCFFNAHDNNDMSKAILEAKKDMDQLEDLVNGKSKFFENSIWKVLFSEDFKRSFSKMKSVRVKASVLNYLLKLSNGWRPKTSNTLIDLECSSQILKKFKVEDMYVICSNDIQKSSLYSQVFKVWNILPLEDIQKFIARLEVIFKKYTPGFIKKCEEKSLLGNLEVPIKWELIDIVRFKDESGDDSVEDSHGDGTDGRDYVENTKVNESLLLMKFFSLTPCIVNHLLSDDSSRDLDLPFEVTDREMEVIIFDKSTFVLGRSGTGKTTVLTMKLFHKEKMYHTVTEGSLLSDEPKAEDCCTKISHIDKSRGNMLRQLFVTVSPKLCYAVKKHVSDLKRFAQGGGSFSGSESVQKAEFFDDAELFDEIPNTFIDVPIKFYPLVITFNKFLLMLDGTLGSSYFNRFFSRQEDSFGSSGLLSISLQNIMRTREVTFDKFAAEYWPHFGEKLKKQLDPSRVFTQIISHIKGGLVRDTSCACSKLNSDDYVNLAGRRDSVLTITNREHIYDMFLQYERMKAENGEYDLADFVIDIHHRIDEKKYIGDNIDFVYIDEVQDLTMRQLSLFKFVCKNVEEGFVFSGDTAQTIARGVDFRFEDIRSLFYNEFLPQERKEKGMVSPIFHLNQNFRTHDGVLRLSNSVIHLLYSFFSWSVDRLEPESSLIYGESPILLESGNDENAIITIFGNSGYAGGTVVGFGAEQVILVRDESARQNISNFVGKQALILTVLECKGLEFQDVLLYNFFSSSSLGTQWRVVYKHMKDNGLLDYPTSFPQFSDLKHSLLCSELKQLYVAITRTRQRLWICETDTETSKPIFDYWRRLSLVQTRKLDDDLARAMQVESTADEWKSRGIKLLQEHNYEMATMCFERAGDAYWERLAKASGLKDSADRIHSSNPEMARTICKEAAEIFEAIGEAKSAAKCYVQLNEFERAGNIYLHKCGEAGLERAGECFSLAGRFELAAEVYAQGNCFSACLHACTEGKLFDTGLQYIRCWKPHHHQLSEAQTLIEVREIEQAFLESCASDYHILDDGKTMMKFVREFPSVASVRAFLTSRGRHADLMGFEEESGNFAEAARIARRVRNFVKEAQLFGKAGRFKDACDAVLWLVLSRSLWCSPSGGRGWPPEDFPGRGALLAEAELLAKKESDSYHFSFLREAALISGEGGSLSPSESVRGGGGLRSEVLAARRLLDAHLGSPDSAGMSPETLVSTWELLKEKVSGLILYLEGEGEVRVREGDSYGEFCLNYLGVKAPLDDDVDASSYVLIYPDAAWVKEIDRRFVVRGEGSSSSVSPKDFVSAARSFFWSELASVGLKVVEKLRSLSGFYGPDSPPLLLVQIFQVAKSLSVDPSGKQVRESSRRLQEAVDQAASCFFRWVFTPLRRRPQTADAISLRETTGSVKLLEEFAESNLGSGGKFTYGKLGRVAVAVFGSPRWPSPALCQRIVGRLPAGDAWAAIFRMLSSGTKLQGDGSYFVRSLFEGLRGVYSVNWAAENDYITPEDFLYLLEGLLILATAFKAYILTTRAAFLEWLICPPWRDMTTTLFTFPLPPEMDRVLDYISFVVDDLLFGKQVLTTWVRRSGGPGERDGRLRQTLLAERLVAVSSLLSVNSPKYVVLLEKMMASGEVSAQVPPELLKVFRECRKGGRLVVDVGVVGRAFGVLRNPLVVVGMSAKRQRVEHKDAIYVHMGVTPSKEDVLKEFFSNCGGGRGITGEVDLSDIAPLTDEVGGGDPRSSLEKMWEVVEVFQRAMDHWEVPPKAGFLEAFSRMKMVVEKGVGSMAAAMAERCERDGDAANASLMEEANSLLTDFMEISYLDFSREHGEKLQQLLASVRSRRGRMEPFLNGLISESGSHPSDLNSGPPVTEEWEDMAKEEEVGESLQGGPSGNDRTEKPEERESGPDEGSSQKQKGGKEGGSKKGKNNNKNWNKRKNKKGNGGR